MNDEKRVLLFFQNFTECFFIGLFYLFICWLLFYFFFFQKDVQTIINLYISRSRVYQVQFMNKICQFLWVIFFFFVKYLLYLKLPKNYLPSWTKILLFSREGGNYLTIFNLFFAATFWVFESKKKGLKTNCDVFTKGGGASFWYFCSKIFYANESNLRLFYSWQILCEKRKQQNKIKSPMENFVA